MQVTSSPSSLSKVSLNDKERVEGESKSPHIERKDGKVYTPDALSRYISEKIVTYAIQDNVFTKDCPISIVDPACGLGVLIDNLSRSLIDRGYSNMIVLGVDSDKTAIKYCKDSLFKNIETVNSTFTCENSLAPFGDNHVSKGWKKLQSTVRVKDGFDLLIANPPWGADLTAYKDKLSKVEFSALHGQIDSYELFIELALKIVRTGGYFGFIVPDSILNHGKSPIRELILTRTKIKFVARLGEKIFPSIYRGTSLIICKNETPTEDSKVDCFRLLSKDRDLILTGKQTFWDAEKKMAHIVPQSRFMNNKYKQFDIDLKTHESKLLHKISSSGEVLGDVLTSTRGIELGGSGIICQCAHCHTWMPLPKNETTTCIKCGSIVIKEKSKKIGIISEEKSHRSHGFITGRDLRRYRISSRKWVLTGLEGINYKNPTIYLPPKILVRKTGVGITAALDYTNAYTNQVVYILKAKPLVDINLEFFIALINSRVYYFFLTKYFGEIEWRSHPYLTQSQVLSLPLPDIYSEKNQSIIKQVSNLVKVSLESSSKIDPENDVKVEALIGKMFSLDIEDYKIIFELISDSDELIPVKELKEVSFEALSRELGN